jgi:histidine ammonia-lyase
VIELGRNGVSRSDYDRVVYEHAPVSISAAALESVAGTRRRMIEHLGSGAAAYGVTTGLGLLAGTPVGPDDQDELQRSLLTARAAGLGPPLKPEIVRGAMLVRLTGFLRGAAGVTPELCAFITGRLNGGWSPVVPNGSYGAAGEIGALAHLFQTFIGEGSVICDGVVVPAAEALRRAGVGPYAPSSKEGLALVNGSPLATALGVSLADRARSLIAAANATAALGIAVTGSGARALLPRIGELEGNAAATRVQRELTELLADEDVWSERTQPPVSARVLPQVHGAALLALAALDDMLENRLRGTTDSPVYLQPHDGAPGGFHPSGGFHAADVVLGMEMLALACCHVVNLLEKRLHRLLDARFSGLPDQLTTRPGARAGVIALHKTVAGLTAESRALAAPASVHAIDTSTGQEDVQSHCFLVATRAGALLDALETSLACELVALRQAVHLAGTRPAGVRLERIVALVEEHVPPIDRDRTLSPDILRARSLVASGAIQGA